MTKMRLSHDRSGQLLEQFWFNPKNSTVYTTNDAPEHGFNSSVDAVPIYDASIAASNLKLIEQAKLNGTFNDNFYDTLQSASLDGDLSTDLEEFDSHLIRHRIKEAGMIGTDNPLVNVVRIYTQLQGLRDRDYSGVELMKRVTTEELIMNFDKVLKMEGLEQLPEMTMPRAKNIAYDRVLAETNKYGMLIRISDEAIRKNVHNPYQDSVTVAGTKVAQIKSFNSIAALDAGLTTVAGTPWDTFVSGTTRSTNNPTLDITRIVSQSIENTNVGGDWTMFGIHQNGGKIYDTNYFLLGGNKPSDTAVTAPGTRPMKGFEGKTMVNDQFIPQGDAFLTDVGPEATGILLEGPSRIATKVDEFLDTRNYAIIDHHLAFVLNPITGVKMTGVYTPLSPP